MATGTKDHPLTDSDDWTAFCEYCNAQIAAVEIRSRAKASGTAKYLLAATTWAARNAEHAPDLDLPSPYVSAFTIASATFARKMAALTALYISACDKRSKAEVRSLQVIKSPKYDDNLEYLTASQHSEAVHQEALSSYEKERTKAINEMCDAYERFSVAIEATPGGITKKLPFKEAYVDFITNGGIEVTLDLIGVDGHYHSATKRAVEAWTQNTSAALQISDQPLT